MLKRQLGAEILKFSELYPVVVVTGPRQSGKTTLTKLCFPEHRYVNLEELDTRAFAKEDPRGFLHSFTKDNKKVIFDEIQHVPELFSYIQAQVDANRIVGQFILTGSQNFALSEHISQSLAGRVAICTLLPLSFHELQQAGMLPLSSEEALLRGFYPSLYADPRHIPYDWYSNYIQTYIERDVRQIKNITDLSLFQRFLKLCIGRVGQLLNFSSLAADCGVSVNTAKGWISLLEASYILFLVQPYHQNFGKRVIKTPKLYFYDSGIVCALLGIENEQQLFSHHLKGNIFESMIISDLLKQRCNKAHASNLFFWRNQVGHEVDCIIEEAAGLRAIEIKSSSTLSSDFFNSLKKWYTLTGATSGTLIYGGDQNQERSIAKVLSWRSIGQENTN